MKQYTQRASGTAPGLLLALLSATITAAAGAPATQAADDYGTSLYQPDAQPTHDTYREQSTPRVVGTPGSPAAMPSYGAQPAPGATPAYGGAATYPPGTAAYPPGAPQSYPMGAPSPNIVGYQPMTQEAMAAAVQGKPVPGQPAANLPPVGTPIATLPPGYETGVIGDGLYTLGRDDIIHIDVRNQPDFSGAFQVGFDGRIQYSYLGDLPVAGLTKHELQQVLEKMLEKYIRVPQVSVSILAYNSKVVYVIGEVFSPGKYIMRGDSIKLREAVLAAGLPNRRAALKRVHVIKPDLQDPEVRVVNLQKILYKGKLEEDIELRPGEVVVVHTKVLAKIGDVLGDILNPVSRSQALNAATTRGY